MGFVFKKKVLVVGDDDEILNQIKMTIENESEKIEVIPYTSVGEALKTLEKEDYDVIVSDYKRLEIDGIKFLKKVRGEKEIEIPFLFLTSKTNQQIILKALKSGANRVIHKGHDDILSSKVLQEALKQEMAHYLRKKELEHNIRNMSSGLLI